MNPPFHGKRSRPNWACDDLSDRGQTQRAKALLALPQAYRARIGAAIDALASDPRMPGTRKPEGGNRLYRLRIGDYRVWRKNERPRRETPKPLFIMVRPARLERATT